MATRIQNGSQARKVASSWRLEARLNAIEQELFKNMAISFNHVRREGNKVADLLANIGVENEQSLLSGNTAIIPNNLQVQECEILIQGDASVPDAGDMSVVIEEPLARHGQPQEL